MKKALLALILAVIFVLSFTLCVSAADENESADTEGDIILGDVNGDGVVTNADVLAIFRYIYNPELYPLPTLCEHSYGDWTIDTLATCETDGEISRTCTKCSEIETSTVKGGHLYEETIVDPTPSDDGYTKHECQRCGDIYKDNFVPALGFTSGFAYTVNSDNKTCTVIGLGSVTATKIAIPEEIDGYKVTAIGEKAFADEIALTEIIIPDTVKTIGTRAFYGCTGLTEMTIPASVTDIGTQIFYKASNLATVYYNSTYGSSSNPFLNLAHIQKVVFGGSYVPSNMLKGYTNVKEIEVLDSVKYIYSDAFYGCTSLTSVTIGNSVTSIGYIAFYNCNNLKEVYITDIAAWLNISFYDYYSNPCYYGAKLYLNGELLTDVNIPDSVTSIGDYAFYKCTSLTSITIPDSVTSIGEWAFYNCTSLKTVYYTSDIEDWINISFYNATSNPCHNGADLYLNGELLTDVNIPDSVTSLGYAFYGCTSLTSIVIPDSVTSISERAFYGCTSLASVTIPDSVTSIGESAFYSCCKLVEVINKSSLSITEGSTSNGEVAHYAIEVHKDDSKIVDKNGFLFYPYNGVNYLVGYKGNETEITLPDDYDGENYEINQYAFSGCDSLTSVTIPDSVTSIGESAFRGCTSLASVIIGDSVTSIGDYAFSGYDSLTSVIIGDSVTSIGERAFAYCTSLTSITIPDSVTSISSYAFTGCHKLVEVINKSSLSITAGSFSNGYVAYYAIEVHTGDSKIVAKDGFLFYTYNGVNYLFGYKGNETEITLPDDYNGENYEIYKYAFYFCTSLTSIVIPDSVTSIGNEAFYCCTSLTSIVIPDSVTSLGSWTFHSCDSLTSVTIPDSVTSIGALTFYYCTSLTSIVIPDSVTSIGNYAFEGCTSLTNIMIPDSVTSIGWSAFRGCTSLTSATIGDGVTSIDDNAFEGCTSLTSVTIPDSVTSICKRAFYECTSLKDVYYTGTQAQWNNISIGSNNSYLTSATIHYNYKAS